MIPQITNDEQLHQAVEQLEGMYRALASLRRELLPRNRRNFVVLAEGPLEQIRQLQGQIDDYTGAAIALEEGDESEEEERARRGDQEKFRRALAKVPDVEPEERDRL